MDGKVESARVPLFAGVRRRWGKRRRQWREFMDVAARFWPYVRKRKGKLGIALALDLGYVAFGLLEPWPIKAIFDYVLLDQPLPAVFAPVGGDRLLLLNLFVAAIVVIALARGLLYFYRQILVAKVGQQVAADLRLDVYSHLQRLSFSFHEQRKTGDLITRLTSDIQVLREMFTTLPVTVTGEAMLVVGMGIVMLVMDWQLALMALIALPCLAILLQAYRRPLKQAIRKQRKREGRLATIASESLGAIKVVQGFHRESYEIERFGAQNKQSLRSGVRAARVEAKLRWGAELAVAVVTALVFAVAARRVVSGALSPGDLLVFMFYLQAFNRPLRRISRMAQRAARTTAAGERILDTLRVESAVRDLPGAVAAPLFRGEIAFEGVSFEYRPGSPVLFDVDLQIAAGERVTIAGPTGAGKSTLVALIPRFYDPTQGRVCIDGRDVRELTLASLRERIALVFQEPVLFATTIRENIAYGKPYAPFEEIVEAAERAGIHRIVSALPDGYDTVLGERGGTLSGGQRQCVAIARAMIRDAPIVLLDEPTVGLDGRSSALVMQALDRLMEGRTVIIISHHHLQGLQTDRVVVVDDGRIVENGTRAPLLAPEARFRRWLGRQGG